MFYKPASLNCLKLDLRCGRCQSQKEDQGTFSSLAVLLVLELPTRPVFPDGGELQAKNLTEIAAVYENVH